MLVSRRMMLSVQRVAVWQTGRFGVAPELPRAGRALNRALRPLGMLHSRGVESRHSA